RGWIEAERIRELDQFHHADPLPAAFDLADGRLVPAELVGKLPLRELRPESALFQHLPQRERIEAARRCPCADAVHHLSFPASGWRERMRRVLTVTACAAGAVSILALSWAAFSDSLPPDATYRPLPTRPFSEIRADDEAEKPAVMRRQQELLQQRYDL